MKVTYLDVNGNGNRTLDEFVFQGTAVVYAAKNFESISLQCDYSLDAMLNTQKSTVRAARVGSRSTLALSRNSLHDQLLVIFGPEMSAQNAIETLQALVEKIKRRGLSIGVDHNGASVVETREGKKITEKS